MDQLFFHPTFFEHSKDAKSKDFKLNFFRSFCFFDFKLNNYDHAKPECDGAYECDIHNKDISCDYQLCD